MEDYEMSYSDCITDEECDAVFHPERVKGKTMKVYEVEQASRKTDTWFNLGWDHVWATKAEAKDDAASLREERGTLCKYRVVEKEANPPQWWLDQAL